jgi:hypothetical protein
MRFAAVLLSVYAAGFIFLMSWFKELPLTRHRHPIKPFSERDESGCP